MKRRLGVRRLAALVTACALATLSASVLEATGAAAAGPAITVDAQAPATELACTPVRFTITAAKPAANDSAQT